MENSRYENGKFYKITDTSFTTCYIGSTCEDLKQRMARHRAVYNNHNKEGVCM